MLSEVLSKIARDFPDHRPVRHFEALLKIKRIAVVASVLEAHELPIIGRFFLRAIDTGLQTPQEIARCLGLEEEDVARSGAVVMGAGLVGYGPVLESGHRALVLTPEGKAFLSGGSAVTIPRRSILYLKFNPLTRKTSIDTAGLFSPRDARNSGLPVIAGESTRMTIGLIDPRDVRDAYREDAGSREILNLISLAQSSVAYLPHIQVVELRHRQTGEERLTVYRGFDYLPDESSVLEDLHKNGRFVVPDDAESFDSALPDVGDVLRSSAARIVQERFVADRQLKDLELRIAARRTSVGQPGDESRAPDVTAQDLVHQVESLQSKLDELQRRSEHGSIEFITTEEHRSWLERALTDAHQEVMIISPWMNERAFDDALMELVAQAVNRGVRVIVGYGFKSDRPDDAERHRTNIRTVTQKLRKITRDHSGLELRDVGSTHQKILICDRQFGITGSFNWLSYRGQVDGGYRLETSVVLRSGPDVERLALLAERTLQVPPQ